jgi:hypothetical protein
VKPYYRAISRRPVPLAYVRLAIVTLLVLMLAWGCAGRDVAAPKGIAQVQHVIVIDMENWSFNGPFGLFPGANGIAHAGDTIRQVRQDDSPYTTLPQPLFNGQPDPRIPSDLPVQPFDLARDIPPDQLTSPLSTSSIRSRIRSMAAACTHSLPGMTRAGTRVASP